MENPVRVLAMTSSVSLIRVSLLFMGILTVRNASTEALSPALSTTCFTLVGMLGANLSTSTS
jgi:hypothetical protein